MVSVPLAFINSYYNYFTYRIVILDEPSSGLDIESRRELWDILLKLRKEKAILVTTHYMEEAEVLGDTICILANGKLQKTGSPLELKRTSGSGYRLKLEAHESNFLKEATLSEIRKFISTASLEVSICMLLYFCVYINMYNFRYFHIEYREAYGLYKPAVWF